MESVDLPRVLLVSNGFGEGVGSHNVCRDLATKLHEAGYTILTTSPKSGRFTRVIDMLQTVWRRHREYEMAQIDVFSGFAFWWALLICQTLRFLRKPVILTLHGGNLPIFAKRWSWMVRWMLRSAATVTTPSRFLQEAMSSYSTHLQLLPNALNLEAYTCRTRLQADPHLVWVRALHRVYNPTLAVRVVALLAAEFPDIRLWMIGPDKGDGSLEEVRALVDKLGMSNHITLVGPVAKSAIPEWLDKGDIFLNTTNVDNTPVSVLEALACGLCVVSTNVGGIPYLLENCTDALLVPPDEAEAMAAAVRHILTTPTLATHLSAQGRAKAELYSWTYILPQWQHLIDTVAEGRAK